MIDAGMEGRRSTDESVHVLACVACPRVSTATARGWRGYLIEDPDEVEEPEIAFYCPACVAREFGATG